MIKKHFMVRCESELPTSSFSPHDEPLSSSLRSSTFGVCCLQRNVPSYSKYVLPGYFTFYLSPTHQTKHILENIKCLHCSAMEPLALGISTMVASDRASYTADDVLDLLQDVEMNIRERDRHFAAAVSPRQIQCSTAPVAPIDDMRHPRIRLPTRNEI